jgi:chorismate mutase-like protein
MPRRRPLRTATAALLALAAAWPGCDARGEPSEAPGEPADARPLLRVGTSGDYPPFSLDGRGLDVDVAERFAADTGLRIEWVPFRWPELSDAIAAGRFDVAMSGVTWRPERALVGYMTQAVAAGGPCLVGSPRPARIAVNRGGILEQWVRQAFPRAEVLAVDDNRSLPGRLRRGEVEAFATDSFEVEHLSTDGAPRRCRPPRDRKVYWVAPARVDDVGPTLDAWLDLNASALDEMRGAWLGAPSPRDATDHLVDLVARRLAFMPHVGAWKRQRGLPIEDAEREAQVLADVEADARALGVDAESTLALFRIQIDLAKALQLRAPAGARPLDLEPVRSVLSGLGSRILLALEAAAPVAPDDLTPARLGPLQSLLEPEEVQRLAAALTRVVPNDPPP